MDALAWLHEGTSSLQDELGSEELEAGEDEASEDKLPHLCAEQGVGASPSSQHIPLLQCQVFFSPSTGKQTQQVKPCFSEKAKKRGRKKRRRETLHLEIRAFDGAETGCG